MMSEPMKILSLGAGVQSTAVLLMSCKGVLPKIDAAIFADTQWEPSAVYAHLTWLEAEAAKHGIPVHRVTAGNIREDALEFRRNRKSADGKRYASLPMFVKNTDGSVGKLPRQCTKEYKIQPIERFIRRTVLGLAPGQRAPEKAVEHWFGISAEEYAHRGRKSMNHWQTFRYPLVFDVESPRDRAGSLFARGFDRQDCKDWLSANGYPEPPRSACIGCPFRSDEEYAALSPDEFADACDFDDKGRELERPSNRGLDGVPFLHRSMVPLRMVQLRPKAERRERSMVGFLDECQGMCGN